MLRIAGDGKTKLAPATPASVIHQPDDGYSIIQLQIVSYCIATIKARR
jgi:hypothetical protein